MPDVTGFHAILDPIRPVFELIQIDPSHHDKPSPYRDRHRRLYLQWIDFDDPALAPIIFGSNGQMLFYIRQGVENPIITFADCFCIRRIAMTRMSSASFITFMMDVGFAEFEQGVMRCYRDIIDLHSVQSLD